MAYYKFDYNQYKQKIHKPKKFVFTILCLIIIILSSILINIKSANSTIDFYFVELNHFYNYNDASKFSQIKKEENISCYIYFDNYYHILISFHSNIEQAKNELKNFSNEKNSKIFSISASKFCNQKNFSNTQNKLIKDVNLEFQKINNFTNFKSNKEDQNILIKISDFRTKFNNLFEEFSKQFKDNLEVKNLTSHLIRIDEILEKIYNLNSENFTQSFKYHLIEIAMEEIEFLNHF